MKLLSGSELVGFIKERQAKQVRGLRQSGKVVPKLTIVKCVDDDVTNRYLKLKQNYGEDILVEVDVVTVEQKDAIDEIKKLNADESVHGIIVQLPLPDKSYEQDVLDAVAPEKDVDGLGANAEYDPATPVAINWLLTGHNIELRGKKIGIVGQGKLVGAPLARMFEASGLDVETADINTENLAEFLQDKEVIVTATGQPGLINSDMIQENAAVVDAGVASDSGVLKGDLAEDVYTRDDLKVTPMKGGVGPLTVAALFDNLIRAANLKRQDV